MLYFLSYADGKRNEYTWFSAVFVVWFLLTVTCFFIYGFGRKRGKRTVTILAQEMRAESASYWIMTAPVLLQTKGVFIK